MPVFLEYFPFFNGLLSLFSSLYREIFLIHWHSFKTQSAKTPIEKIPTRTVNTDNGFFFLQIKPAHFSCPQLYLDNEISIPVIITTFLYNLVFDFLRHYVTYHTLSISGEKSTNNVDFLKIS